MAKQESLKVMLKDIMTFDNYFLQYVKTFFGEDAKMTKEQEGVLRTTFYSGAAALNMIIETLNRMNIEDVEKEEVLTKILTEVEFLFVQPNPRDKKQ